MKKFESIALSYSPQGYFLYFTPLPSNYAGFSFSATFQQIERTKEYIEFQAGKSIAKKFDPWFEEIKTVILKTPIDKQLSIAPFVLNLKK